MYSNLLFKEILECVIDMHLWVKVIITGAIHSSRMHTLATYIHYIITVVSCS